MNNKDTQTIIGQVKSLAGMTAIAVVKRFPGILICFVVIKNSFISKSFSQGYVGLKIAVLPSNANLRN